MNIVVLKVLLFFATYAECANILGVFLYPSKSHDILSQILLKELASKGHNVTMLGVYPMENPKMENFQHIYIGGSSEDHAKSVQDRGATTWDYLKFYNFGMKYMLDDILLDEKMQTFLKSNETFDVCISMLQYSEVFLGISHKVNARTIAFNLMNSGDNYLSGNPQLYSYVPNWGTHFTNYMNFGQRMINTFAYIFDELVKRWFQIPMQKQLLRKHFPSAPSLELLMESVDLHFLNTNNVFEWPRPYLPNVIQVGGFHMQEKEKISMELEKFLNESSNGLVLLSFGTNLKANDLPQNILQSIISSLSKSTFNFIVKFEGKLAKVPKNVRLLNWIPQRTILAHRNTKIFISHGGLNSIYEAIYFGVPMIGLPYSHQLHNNVANMINHGLGLTIPLEEITEEKLSWAIEEISSNLIIQQVVNYKSSIFRKKDLHPLDKAVFWVEYLAGFKGAYHLKAPAYKIPFYQYVLLDILFFYAMLNLCGCFVVFLIGKWMLRKYLRRRDNEIKHKTV